LALSKDVYSAHPFAKAEAVSEATEDERFETMSRAAEAMSLSEMGLPPVHFGYLNPIPTMAHDDPNVEPTSLAMPPGVCLLLAEWVTGTDPDQYVYHDPYDDHQPAATTVHRTPNRKNGGGGGTQATQAQSQSTAMAAPPVVAHSRAAPSTMISSSQTVMRRRAGSFDGSDGMGLNVDLDSYEPMASTQVEPGPFGGRLPTIKKKAVPGKKRVGGF
jgi:hypothetical protein